ncbi:hypothetical protein MSAR_26230 [Mycolicibacterium sarraceniae]|uniref:Uncharacterized protein n=1 Tax=Mycolicibacterium sarraceniae TaxID=1534348 RepID=A0A7I7SR52_9MYCO|nr:hypothetical protein MSAR_26230 [Mycolicibacterium sarraceniae]
MPPAYYGPPMPPPSAPAPSSGIRVGCIVLALMVVGLIVGGGAILATSLFALFTRCGTRAGMHTARARCRRSPGRTLWRSALGRSWHSSSPTVAPSLTDVTAHRGRFTFPAHTSRHGISVNHAPIVWKREGTACPPDGYGERLAEVPDRPLPPSY